MVDAWLSGNKRGKSEVTVPGLENSTRLLVFTSTKGCRASENFEIANENQNLPIYANNFCDAGQVSIFRYFEACSAISNSLAVGFTL